MMTPVILPQLGDTMNEGTILTWFKREGERVEKGEPLFEVLTDKANMQVEATTSGYLRAIVNRENETVPTGQVIAYLAATLDEPLPPEATTLPQKATETVAAIKTPRVSTQAPGATRAISPRARRLSEEKGVDLTQVMPSRPNARVVEADVLRYIERRNTQLSPTNPALAGEESTWVVPLQGVRQVIAERMSASARQVARVTLTTEADATRLVELRDEINRRVDNFKFTFTDFFVMLAAKALQKHPQLNSTLEADGIHQHAAVNVGVPVDTDRGLVVLVIRNAQKKVLSEIAHELRALSEQARSKKISPDDLCGSTFTITNLGQYDIDAFTPIVNLPEVAILGIGRIAQKPTAYQGQLALRQMVALSLSFDHRVVDGAPAARFLQHIKQLVETPGLLLV